MVTYLSSFLLILLISTVVPFILSLVLIRHFFHLGRVLFWLSVILFIFQLTVFICIPLNKNTEYHQILESWKDNPSQFKDSSADFTIITLSYICQGLEKYSIRHADKKEEILRVMKDIIDTALRPEWNPYRASFGLKWLDNRGLYLSHLSLMFSIYTRLSGENEYFIENSLVYIHFLRILSYSADLHLQSYPQPRHKWPADNAVIYAALDSFGGHYQYTNHTGYLQLWKDLINTQYLDTNTGLPVSEITGRTSYSKYPRGSANAWMVYYLYELDPDLALTYWEQFKKYYIRQALVFTAFREYPPGVNLPPDSDSGPIFLGYGSATSSLALMAAARVEDHWTWWQLQYSQTVVAAGTRILKWLGFKYIFEVYHSPLALALRFNF